MSSQKQLSKIREAMDPKVESKFIQQHLANERTYLAWIRTSITTIGLGFLAAGVVFHASTYSDWGHMLAMIVGVGAVLCGGLLIVLATRDYYQKRIGINEESFSSANLTVSVVSILLSIINLLLLGLVIIMLFS